MDKVAKRKRCTKCKKRLSVDKFSKDKLRKDGLCFWCKICTKDYDKQYYKNNLQRFRKRELHWNKTEEGRAAKRKHSKTDKGKASSIRARHTRRARVAGANTKIKPATSRQIVTLFKSARMCPLCNNSEGSFVENDSRLRKTIDHILPISKGGGNNIENFQVVHLCCNSSKGNKVA